MLKELRTAQITFHEKGFVNVRVSAGIVQSIRDAQGNLDAAVAITGGTRRPILIDLRVGEPLETEVRRHYSGSKLASWFTGLALVIPPTLFGKMMGNIYLRLARPGVPIRLFDDYDAAVTWLTVSLKDSKHDYN